MTGSGMAQRDGQTVRRRGKSPGRVVPLGQGDGALEGGIWQLPMLGRECRFIAGYQTLRRGVLKVGT
jgi:hypothetical protein